MNNMFYKNNNSYIALVLFVKKYFCLVIVIVYLSICFLVDLMDSFLKAQRKIKLADVT